MWDALKDHCPPAAFVRRVLYQSDRVTFTPNIDSSRCSNNGDALRPEFHVFATNTEFEHWNLVRSDKTLSNVDIQRAYRDVPGFH